MKRIKRIKEHSVSDLMIIRRAKLDVLRRLLDDSQRRMGYNSIDEQIECLKLMLSITNEINRKIKEVEGKDVLEFMKQNGL